MASEEQVKNLHTIFQEISDTEIQNLISNEKWGSINFEAAKPDLERLYSLCNHFKTLPINQLPENIAEQIFKAANPIKNTIHKIRQFTIEQSNPSGVRDNYVQEVKNNVDNFYMSAHLYIPYLAYQKGDIQKNIKQLTKSKKEAEQLIVDAKNNVIAKNNEIDEIINAAREASASVGVAHFTADFDAEAKNVEGQADKWLFATIFLAILSLIASIYFLFFIPNIETTANAVQYVSSKILILILLITATLWCGNLYKATKHQVAVNKFKSNSLKTFQAFVKATDDNAVRDAVLIETTRAIFSESDTGYISNKGAGAEKSTKIVEIVKSGVRESEE